MTRIMFTIFFIISVGVLSASEIEEKESATINAAIDMMYQEHFEEALGIFTYIKDTYPDYPIGDFFLGFYYNFLSSFYETDKFNSKIVLYYDLAEKKAEFHLNYNEDDPWHNFYMGASLINRGYMLGKDGSRFSGISKTFDGISYIEDCLDHDKDLGDALMLLGSYKYYKSTILSWVYDRRDLAVMMLKQSIDSSMFSKYLAISNLGWIYIDYEKYDKAEEMADKALEKYPESHLFLFLKARALYEMKRYNEAIEIYLRIESKMNSMQEKYSEIDLFNTFYFLTKCYFSNGDKVNSEKYLELALFCKLSKKERNTFEDRLDDLNELKESEFR